MAGKGHYIKVTDTRKGIDRYVYICVCVTVRANPRLGYVALTRV